MSVSNTTTRQPEQFGHEYSSIFKDASVASAYRFRPEYPPETFDILAELIDRDESPCAVLDAASGSGFLARHFLEHADRIDAVDFSAAMIDEGRGAPGGDSPRINWVCSSVEDAPLAPPYALIMVGDAMHWLEWDRVLPRFAASLSPNGMLAIVELAVLREPWTEEILKITQPYSMNQKFQPYNMMTVAAELQRRSLFEMKGSRETADSVAHQPIADVVESVHARNGFSRDRMDASAAAECDELLTRAYSRHFPGGIVTYRYRGRVIWGRPLTG